MDERYIEHVSTESPELIRENECEYNIGTLVTYRFRRLWNEIVDLREQLDAARRTTPDREAGLEDAALLMEQRAAEIEACGGLTAGTMARIYRDEASKIRALKTAPTPSPRDALIEEIAEMVDHMGEGRRLEEYVGAIREMKGGKS